MGTRFAAQQRAQGGRRDQDAEPLRAPAPARSAPVGMPLFLRRTPASSAAWPASGEAARAAAPVPVQRQGNEPHGAEPTPPAPLAQPDRRSRYRLGGDLQLRLDPELLATIQQMLREQVDAGRIRSGISGVYLGALTPAAPGTTEPTAPAVTPTGGPALPAPHPLVPPGAGPATPRPGTTGDVVNAVLAVPAFDAAAVTLRARALEELSTSWGRLGTGERVGVVSALTVIGAGAAGGILANPDSRRFALDQLNGRPLPVPGVPWMRLELNTARGGYMVGLHLDLGELLPPILGFGPSSPSAIGGPPQPQPFTPGAPVQRTAASGAAAPAELDLGERIRAASGGGHPLEEPARARLERALGADLSDVKVHTDPKADRLARAVDAVAFTTGRSIFFREGAYQPSSPDGMRVLAHEAAHTVQQARGPVAGAPAAGGVTISAPGDAFEQEAEQAALHVGHAGQASRASAARGGAAPAVPVSHAGPPAVQRWGKGGSGGSTAATGDLNAGGESATPSDQSGLAKGYAERPDGQYDTPDGRVVSAEQARDESLVINSSGIFMGAYLARYNALRKHKLSEADMDRLSAQAGFTQQLSTGDVVMRLMSAEDSAGLAKITSSSYSHAGIVQKRGGRAWVLDSYPGRKVAGQVGSEDSSQLIRFEDFFGDHGKEQIINGIVLRVEGLSKETQEKIDKLIDVYKEAPTKFDYEFKVDNDKYVLYCSELVWRILTEAGSPVLPPNEFATTKQRVTDLIGALEGLVEVQRSQGHVTKEAEGQLKQLRDALAKLDAFTAPELYSPGSLERTPGLKTIAGFNREGKIRGSFALTVLDGTLPDDTWDTPDAYVKMSAGFLGGTYRTSIKHDTTSPVWNEQLTTLPYDELHSVKLEVWDYDTLSDDLLATLHGDLRPVKPSGQTFTLSGGSATLRVKLHGDNVDVTTPAPRELPQPPTR